MQADITLSFGNLTTAQAQELCEAYQSIKDGRRMVHHAPVGNEQPRHPDARTAEPSTGSTTATADQDTGATPTEGDAKHPAGTLDSRGVPLHPTYHNGNVKGDGSWTRRRNHDKAAADAYEAPFLGRPAVPLSKDNSPANFSDGGTTGIPLAQAAAAAYQPEEPVASTSIAPAATFEAPAVRYLPSPEEYEAKWKQLCRDSKVTGEHQAFIERTFGSHPLNPAIFNIEENRRQIWVVFLQWEAGVKGF